MPTSTESIQFSIQYASIALIYYDYALTFEWEIKYIWGARFRVSTLLYVCNRYSLIANVLYLVSILDKTSSRCDVGYKICSALSVLGRASIIMVWTARLYAVYNKNKIILAYFSSVGLTCIALDIAHATTVSCRGSSNIVSTVLAGLMCLFEVSAALCTTIRTFQALLSDEPSLRRKGGMVYLLLEQGIAYFTTVTCFTIAAFVLSLRAPGGFFQRLLNALTLPLSCLMTARFLLHLRRWEHKHTAPKENTIDSIQFNANVAASRSLLSDFGEDPVRRAERDVQTRQRALGEARAIDTGDSREPGNHGEGSSVV